MIEYGEITPLANGSVDIHVHVCSALIMGIKFRVFTFCEGFISVGVKFKKFFSIVKMIIIIIIIIIKTT